MFRMWWRIRSAAAATFWRRSVSKVIVIEISLLEAGCMMDGGVSAAAASSASWRSRGPQVSRVTRVAIRPMRRRG